MRQMLSKYWALRRKGRNFEQATANDVYYCFRLFLKREPDEKGWRHWTDLVVNHGIGLQTLVNGFLLTQEFQDLQKAAAEPKLIELELFKIFVLPSDHFIGGEIIRSGGYEPHVASEIQRLLEPGSVFVDLGASIGYFSLLAAALVRPSGLVYAFEPNPSSCRLFQRSIRVNDFSNIRLFNWAIAESAQSFKLDIGPWSNARVIDISPEAVPGIFVDIEVDAVALDIELNDVERIDVIKMDIEGAEPRAWQGMQQIIKRHRPILVFEFSPGLIQITSHIAPETFLDSIQASDYDIFELERTGGRSSKPFSREEIMGQISRSGLTHLDLVAQPR